MALLVKETHLGNICSASWTKLARLPAKLLFFIWLVVLACASVAYSQGTTQYIYDANGRLTGVIAPSGDANVYHYDPAGNITSIEQVSAGGFSVVGFTPQVGAIGDQVTLSGVGLDTASSASFNGTPSQIVSASPNSLVTVVPDGATTGLITISGVRGAATTASAFTVVGRVQISPSSVDLLPGESVQFQVSIIGTSNQQVTWAVNGVSGNGLVGTISTNGLYQSPSINHGLTVAITATSQADTSVVGQATVRVLNPNIGSEVRAPVVSVSVGFDAGSAVSVFSRPVAVQVGASEPVFSSPVSVTNGPVVNGVSPSTLSRGGTSSIVISGQNLSGALAIFFVAPGGGLEQNISVTNITPSADGTSLSFTAVVGANANAGIDVVFVVTPNGQSATFNTGGNTVQVQ